MDKVCEVLALLQVAAEKFGRTLNIELGAKVRYPDDNFTSIYLIDDERTKPI